MPRELSFDGRQPPPRVLRASRRCAVSESGTLRKEQLSTLLALTIDLLDSMDRNSISLAPALDRREARSILCAALVGAAVRLSQDVPRLVNLCPREALANSVALTPRR
jgi:hypothetical protein